MIIQFCILLQLEFRYIYRKVMCQFYILFIRVFIFTVCNSEMHLHILHKCVITSLTYAKQEKCMIFCPKIDWDSVYSVSEISLTHAFCLLHKTRICHVIIRKYQQIYAIIMRKKVIFYWDISYICKMLQNKSECNRVPTRNRCVW